MTCSIYSVLTIVVISCFIILLMRLGYISIHSLTATRTLNNTR